MKCICFAALGQRWLCLIPPTPEVDPILKRVDISRLYWPLDWSNTLRTHLLFVLFRICIHDCHVGQFEVIVAENVFRNGSNSVFFPHNDRVVRRPLPLWGKLKLSRVAWQCSLIYFFIFGHNPQSDLPVVKLSIHRGVSFLIPRGQLSPVFILNFQNVYLVGCP